MSEPAGISIGRAAALYDLAPSTLRWWESQRVLPKPARVNGRRVYDETELRRIGLAYLCCVTGVMSLEQTAVVTTARHNDHWRSTVRSHARALEKKIEELRSAQAYLKHLLDCPDDDIVDECPWLDGELMTRTPRGRVAVEGLVAAAQSIPRETPAPDTRDETCGLRDETPSPPRRCTVCDTTLRQPETGRRRLYCSRACRQRQYRQQARPQ